MNRRHLLAAPVLLLPTAAQAEPWDHEVLLGGFDGAVHHLGLRITLEKGWKTYWRVPGDGGIPPQITVGGTNLKDFSFALPLPQRYEDASGETIGYKDEVIFPITVSPLEADQPIRADVKAFVGVCEVVCIPANVSDSVRLSPLEVSPRDANLIQVWQQRVPRPSTSWPVTALKAEGEDLVAALGTEVTDLFVEFLDGKEGFATKPKFEGNLARIPVKGTAKAGLSGREVKITSAIGGPGLEQVLTIA